MLASSWVGTHCSTARTSSAVWKALESSLMMQWETLSHGTLHYSSKVLYVAHEGIYAKGGGVGGGGVGGREGGWCKGFREGLVYM